MPLEYRKMIYRADMRKEPETLFIFGDNMKRYGKGGQAKEARGEPNAIGIPTKNAPHRNESAYFTDDDFDVAKPEIDAAFDRLEEHLNSGGNVVWPKDGIGTGLASLQEKAPKIWAYLEERRRSLETLDAEGS